MFSFKYGDDYLDQAGVWYNDHICLVYDMRSDYMYLGGLGVLTEVGHSITIMSV